jgi:hypothetical protein
MQMGELLKLLQAHPLGLFSLLLGIGCYVGQAMGILLGHFSRPMRLLKLTLKKDDLLDKALCVLARRG